MENILSQLDAFIRTLVANPYFGLAGFIIGVVSLAYAFQIAKRDKKVVDLYHNLVSTNIIADSKKLFEKLSITYDGDSLDNFSVAKIRIKNIGTETIKSTDIAQSDPITIRIIPSNVGAKMLDYSILSVSNPNNNFKASEITDNAVRLSFDFMEPKDTITLQILHTGIDASCIAIMGTVIGSKTPFAKSTHASLYRIATPLEKFFAGMLTSTRRTALILPMIFMIIFGGFAYLLYRLSNLALSVTCLIPFIFFASSAARIIFRKSDKDKESHSRDLMVSILEKALSRVELQANIYDTTNKQTK
jgi:hypothetical protein